ncbi:hypothetical protein FRC04_012243 [Tulasnella sp. 424]|nr:hypothetical protein FRC04_012243 [Tulasnella sp. 424]
MPITPSVQPPIHTTDASGLPGSHQILGISRMELQRESQFAQLPPEVLLLIIDHLKTAGKISLLATCQYLRQLSEPLLYHHLTLDGSWKSCRRIQLLKTLGERQDLLPCIRSFRGHLIPTSIRRPSQPNKEVDPWDSEVGTLLQDEWLAISTPLLLQAINIRDLEITGSIDWQANGRWELFKRAISNMKLRSLALGSTSKEPLDFTPILRGQPELTRLELTYPTAHFEGLENLDVQKLKVFRGTWQQAATIVPGRPVRRLDMGCGDMDDCRCEDEHIFQKLLQSSETVRELRLLEEIPKLSMITSLRILNSWFTNSSAGPPRAGSDHLDINTWKKLSEKLKKLCPSLSDVRYTPPTFSCGMFESKTTSSSLRFI